MFITVVTFAFRFLGRLFSVLAAVVLIRFDNHLRSSIISNEFKSSPTHVDTRLPASSMASTNQELPLQGEYELELDQTTLGVLPHPSNSPTSSYVYAPPWTGGHMPRHQMSEKELKALEVFNGPPPGMPNRLLLPEDRQHRVVARYQNDAVRKNSNSRALPQQAAGHAGPKPPTKHLLHQLVQPAGIAKARTNESSVLGSLPNVVKAAGYDITALQPTSSAIDGQLSNGRPLLPALRLSRLDYRMLGEYALRNNGRIPFKQGLGLPAYGKLVFQGPGRLGVVVDRRRLPQTASHGRLDFDGGDSMIQSSDVSNGQQLQPVTPVTALIQGGLPAGTVQDLQNSLDASISAALESGLFSSDLIDLPAIDQDDGAQYQAAIDDLSRQLDEDAFLAWGEQNMSALQQPGVQRASQQPS